MSWRDQVTLQFAWLLQFTNAVGFFFLLFLAIKYGHIRLGRRDEKPEFSYMTTLAMLLAAGAGPGCLVFATAGPLSNRFGNFFAQPAYRSQDEVDLFALNVSVFEWGILMWTRYTLIGVCMALAGNRFGLPLTIRSCFFPILGHYTWGWMGDVIDGIALVAGVAGSIIIMTFTIVQIVTCMMYLGWMDSNSSEEDIKSTRNLSICVVTIMSTASVISGLRGGVRFFSRVAMMLCTLLVLLLTTLDDTKYVLNLSVQEIGYHLQTSMFQLNFWTDAFGQLRAGSGRATDGGASDPTWFNTQFAIYHSVSYVRSM